MAQWQIEWLSETDSTNNELKRRTDAPNGTVVAARRQTAGRGRLGRSFVSQDGGLYLSALLRPELPPERLLHLTAMVAVAVRRAIAEIGVETQIKWVNDLLCDGKKLCGILVEWSGRAAIVGIGINCNTQTFPDELTEKATSIRNVTKQIIDIDTLAVLVVRELRRMEAVLLTERAKWLEEYAANCLTIGRPVKLLRIGRPPCEAFAVGIDETAALNVRLADGSIETVQSGEAVVRGIDGYI